MRRYFVDRQRTIRLLGRVVRTSCIDVIDTIAMVSYDQHDGTISPPPMGQAHFSGWLDLSRITMSQLVSSLARAGLLVIRRGKTVNTHVIGQSGRLFIDDLLDEIERIAEDLDVHGIDAVAKRILLSRGADRWLFRAHHQPRQSVLRLVTDQE